jgi:predicted nucleic acid-binding protein
VCDFWVQALHDQRFVGLASVPLVLEYEAVLKRPEHLLASKRTVHQVDAFLDALCLSLQLVHLFYLWRPQCKDLADDMVLETALNGQADALITLNTADFGAAGHFHLPVLTPGKLIHKLRLKEQ